MYVQEFNIKVRCISTARFVTTAIFVYFLMCILCGTERGHIPMARIILNMFNGFGLNFLFLPAEQ